MGENPRWVCQDALPKTPPVHRTPVSGLNPSFTQVADALRRRPGAPIQVTIQLPDRTIDGRAVQLDQGAVLVVSTDRSRGVIAVLAMVGDQLVGDFQ
jgi:hypothetical protein